MEKHELNKNIEALKNETDHIKKGGHLSSIVAMELCWTLATTVDAKDPYTNGHSERVADLSLMIAKKMGKDKVEARDIYYSALLHDIGKIGIPDDIIKKTDKLTNEEYQLIRSHPTIGGRILSNVASMPVLSIGAEYHHERYDGKGYPKGLKGDEIPEYARIISIADTYDTMTSKRPYSGIRPQAEVRAEIERCSGQQFDPEIAKIMLQIIDEDKDYDLHG